MEVASHEFFFSLWLHTDLVKTGRLITMAKSQWQNLSILAWPSSAWPSSGLVNGGFYGMVDRHAGNLRSG